MSRTTDDQRVQEETYRVLCAFIEYFDRREAEEGEQLTDAKGHVIRAAGAVRDEVDDYPSLSEIDIEEALESIDDLPESVK